VRPFRIKAVLFDFDGTLTEPGALDFAQIGRAVGTPPGRPVLEHIEGVADAGRRSEAFALLERFELEAAALSRPNAGAEEAVRRLRGQGLVLGIITRNAMVSVERAFKNFSGISAADFALIMTRDLPMAPKPAPDGILEAARLLDVAVEDVMIVGDYTHDIEAGTRAGAVTVLLENGSAGHLAHVTADFRISSLTELASVVRLGLPLPEGKLPNDLLQPFLADIEPDRSVLVGPALGEDAAVVEVPPGDAVVLKCDPITFATVELPTYALQVNANDVASLGGAPRWYLATLLFPAGSTPSEVLSVMEGIRNACAASGVGLCGGHTEITSAVTRPVVSGTMVGTVPSRAIVHKSTMQPGDHIVLTKRLAVEGTALLARERGEDLLGLGMTPAALEASRSLLEHISVVEEARMAAACGGVTSLHDITEGGLATALRELSAAGGWAVRVERELIPVYPETTEVCRLLGLDPLGLIGSGSLLIACREAQTPALLEDLHSARIEATAIGRVLDEPATPIGIVCAFLDGSPTPWPSFVVDEAARALGGTRA
jgi:HAD superfamily hydrolase (TIGR01509 family)